MKKRFKEIRVFYGNEYVGHDYCRVEFVFDNNTFQNRLMKLSGDPRVHYSRSKTGEFVLDASVNPSDFIYALKRTDLSTNMGATIYYEACLLAQDYTNRGAGVNYYKDDDGSMPVEELIDIAGAIYFDEEERAEMNQFKNKCLEIVRMEESKSEDGKEQ